MNNGKGNKKFHKNSIFSPFYSGGSSCPLTQEQRHTYQLVLSLIPPMADNTRSHALSRLEEAVTLLTTTQTLLHSRLDEIASRLQALETPSPTLSLRPPPPRMNLDVPRFDDTNAPTLIFKISQFFDYHRTPEDERLQVT